MQKTEDKEEGNSLGEDPFVFIGTLKTADKVFHRRKTCSFINEPSCSLFLQ